MAIVVTEQEFQEWIVNPVTKAFFKALHNDREFMKEELCRGSIPREEQDEVRGRCNAILQINNVSYEDLVEGARDDNKY
jgi:hypothetical protein